MPALCVAARAAISKVLGREPLWIDTEEEPSSCSLKSDAFLIKLFIDPRDRSVSSSITFLNQREPEEELYTHVITRLFPDIDDGDEPSHSGDQIKIAREAEKIAQLLVAMEKDSVSPRDLLYFYFGYNSAYSHYMNSR
jgi:hypothetical protein